MSTETLVRWTRWTRWSNSHGPDYLSEALGLAAFMLAAGAMHTALEHPASPLHQSLPTPLRLAVFGFVMGGVTLAILSSPGIRRSGGHINPAVTLAFLRLGRISPGQAAAYLLAQFAGSLIAPLVLAVVLGEAFAHPAVGYSATRPGAWGPWGAFWAEFLISFVLMAVVLVCVNSRRLRRFTPAAAGALIALYIAVESPLSGMSLNPARSFGSAVAARDFGDLWIYFTAPPAAMLLAAELFAWARRRGWTLPDYAEGPRYPIREALEDEPGRPPRGVPAEG